MFIVKYSLGTLNNFDAFMASLLPLPSRLVSHSGADTAPKCASVSILAGSSLVEK
jgi:hypothetical protein